MRPTHHLTGWEGAGTPPTNYHQMAGGFPAVAAKGPYNFQSIGRAVPADNWPLTTDHCLLTTLPQHLLKGFFQVGSLDEHLALPGPLLSKFRRHRPAHRGQGRLVAHPGDLGAA